jgi:hypothetical protein
MRHETFSEDGSMPESGLKLVIDQAREAMKIDRAVATSDMTEYGPLREVGTRNSRLNCAKACSQRSFLSCKRLC